MAHHQDEHGRAWLVDRTYSDDEQNIVVLIYATTDGEYAVRKERALTSFSDTTDTTAAVETSDANLGAVNDPELQAEYAELARSMAEDHDPDDIV